MKAAARPAEPFGLGFGESVGRITRDEGFHFDGHQQPPPGHQQVDLISPDSQVAGQQPGAASLEEVGRQPFAEGP